MKKIFAIVAISGFLTACGNSSESSSNAETTSDSTTPPATADTTTEMGAMMGDTSTVVADSIQK